MTLKEAKVLRNRIYSGGLHCTVPLGHGPCGYFARIITHEGPRDFQSWTEYDQYRKERNAKRAAKLAPPRSPIEHMIDRACGLID